VLHGCLLQVILEHGDFLNIDILQGSVATRLRCGAIFKYEFVADLPLSLSAKEFRKWLTLGEVIGKSLMSCFFDSRCSIE